MWVLFGILTGSTLFGAWGMIIAMPILVTIKISYRVYRQHNPQPNNLILKMLSDLLSIFYNILQIITNKIKSTKTSVKEFSHFI